MPAQVVAQQGTQDEILLGGEFVQGARGQRLNHLDTLAAAEEEVYLVAANGLYAVVDALFVQPVYGKLFVAAVGGVEYHVAHPLLVFIDVVQEYFQLGGEGLAGNHGRSAFG